MCAIFALNLQRRFPRQDSKAQQSNSSLIRNPALNEATDQPVRPSPAVVTARFAALCALVGLVSPLPAIAADAEQPMPQRGAVVEKARAEANEAQQATHSEEPPPPAAPKIMGPVATISDDVFYGPPVPKSRGGNVPVIDWTEPGAIVPPALGEAVNIVTKNYPSALSERAALQAAASDVKSAKWLRFPSVTGNLAYLDDERGATPQVVVEAPIWSGGRISSNIRRARAEEDVSSARYVEIVQELARTTAQAYFEVARLTQREQLLESSLKEHVALVETMERRVAQEISPQADLELARSRAAQIEQDYTITAAQRRTTLRVLAELIADPTYDLGPLPQYDPEAPLTNREALEDQAVAYSPTMKRLNGQADVARADLDARRASLFPQVGAQYSYDDVFGSRVGVVVRAQNTGGLSQLSDVNSARLRIQSALETIRVSEQQLRRDIESSLIQYDAAKRRAEISQNAATTAARVSASYTRQFIAGRRSWLDVMNALREAVTAEIGRTEAEVTVMSTATQLLLLSGRWRPVFSEQENF